MFRIMVGDKDINDVVAEAHVVANSYKHHERAMVFTLS